MILAAIIGATPAAIAAAQQPGKSHLLYYCLIIFLSGLSVATWTYLIRQLVIAWCEFTIRREQHTAWLKSHKSHSSHRSHHGTKAKGTK